METNRDEQTDDRCTIVYQYGLLQPTKNGDLVREQMRYGHNFRNDLVSIERERRPLLRDVLASATEAIRVAEEEYLAAKALVEQHESAVKKARAKSRARTESRRDRDLLTAARKRKNAARKVLAEARRAAKEDPEIVSAMKAVHEQVHPKVLAAYAGSPAYSPTKDLQRSAMDQSRRAPLWDKEGQPNDPRFLRWRGEGSIGVQLTSPSCQTDEGRSRWIRLDPVIGDGAIGRKADPNSKTSQRRRRMVLWMRVSSDGRDPVWATWPMTMHRPLPDGAVIRRAVVHCRKIGPTERWCVDLTLAVPTSWKRERCGAGAVGLDLGWRELGDGRLRVGYWAGEDGSLGELALSAYLVESLTKPSGIQRTRDKNRDFLSRWLWRWCRKNAADMPEWMRKKTETLYAWKSQARFASLCKQWEREAPDFFPRVLEVFEAWRYRDYHLWEYEEHARANSLATRRNLYRAWGKMLAQRYSHLVVEDFDVREVAVRPLPEQKSENEHARSMRVCAAVSELRLAVQQAFTSRGGRWNKVDPAGTTCTCRIHGEDVITDPASSITVEYACGCIEDQDEHAALSLLDRRPSGPVERSGDAERPSTARRKILSSDDQKLRGTKWQRRKAARERKAALEEASRNESPKIAN